MVSDVVSRIRHELNDACTSLYSWFAVDDALMNYVPPANGWTIRQNLEHITLTNHYLLILINKATRKAVENANKEGFFTVPVDYNVDWAGMEAIGRHGSFTWVRPQHMQPQGLAPLDTIADKLARQGTEIKDCLNSLSNGEGVLYKTMMSVNNLGKIDVYHYIYFLVQHMKRHIGQMEKIKLGFDQL